MSAAERQAAVPKPKRRWFSLRKLLVVSFLIIPTLAVTFAVTGLRAIFAFRKAVAMADRVVVRDGGFDCCGPVDDEAILFEVTDPAEIKTVLMHLDFTGRTSPCECCGFPGIDWYRGKERIALTAMQHRKAMRWADGGDLCLRNHKSGSPIGSSLMA